MKIDLHTHILPHNWPDLDAKYGYSGFVRLDHYKPCCARMMIGDRVFREITDNVWDPNSHIAGIVRNHPKRFAGLATIPLQDPDLAAGELERCVHELGLRGAQIGTHVDANQHTGRIDTL